MAEKFLTVLHHFLSLFLRRGQFRPLARRRHVPNFVFGAQTVWLLGSVIAIAIAMQWVRGTGMCSPRDCANSVAKFGTTAPHPRPLGFSEYLLVFFFCHTFLAQMSIFADMTTGSSPSLCTPVKIGTGFVGSRRCQCLFSFASIVNCAPVPIEFLPHFQLGRTHIAHHFSLPAFAEHCLGLRCFGIAPCQTFVCLFLQDRADVCVSVRIPILIL